MGELKRRLARLPYPVACIVFALTYLISALLGLLLAMYDGAVSPLWPAAGLSVAVLNYFGVRYAPAVFVGAFLASLQAGNPPVTALTIGVGNALEGVVAVTLMRTFRPKAMKLAEVADVFTFALLGAAIPAIVGGVLGTFAISLSLTQQDTSLIRVMLLWWSGDVLGIALVAPLIVSILEMERHLWPKEGRQEVIIIAFSMLLLSLCLFGPFNNLLQIHLAAALVVFPFIVWSALRFHLLGGTVACSFLCIIAIVGTAHGTGPFAAYRHLDVLSLLQVFIGACTLTGLLAGSYASEKERTSRALRLSEARMQRFYSCNMIGMMIANMKGSIIDANDNLLALLKYTREDLENGRLRWDEMTPPSYKEMDRKKLAELSEAGVAGPWEKEYITKDGKVVPVVVGAAVVDDSDGECICFVLDMSERSQYEAKLKQAYDHVKTLNERLHSGMTETHHRVKNSLQVISSLLSIELRKHGAITADNLRKIISHVQSFATLHDILTLQVKELGDISTVCARSILERSLSSVERTMGTRPLHSKLDPCPISPRQGASLAVVANELLSNALKFGDGIVSVTLTAREGRADLEFTNEGSEFGPTFSVEEKGSTGLKLVMNLCRSDLGGEPKFISSRPGFASVIISFPYSESSEQGVQNKFAAHL